MTPEEADGAALLRFLDHVKTVGVEKLSDGALDNLMDLVMDEDSDPDLLLEYGVDIITRLRGER